MISRVPLWPSEVNLGIRTEGWAASRDKLSLRVLALDTSGKPVAGKEITVDLFHTLTYSYRKRLIGGFYAYEHTRDTQKLEEKCAGKTDEQGILFCELEPGVSGSVTIRARARDGSGNETLATREAWVAGGDDWWFEVGDNDRMDLIPEQKEYESGDVARFQVRMPFRSAQALVTVEREGVIDSFVTELSGREPVVEVPIDPRYAPNVYVSVLAVRGRVGWLQSWIATIARKLNLPWQIEGGVPTGMVDLSKPAYRLGLAEIRVGWKPHRLDVKVNPARTVYKVREQAAADIEVKRADGKPLPEGTELAIAVVDEGLLELKPNESWALLDRMMAKRGIEVYTYTSQVQVIGKRHYGRKADPHGGGGGRANARELFETLLLWKGRVPVGADGRAHVEFPLNDSLTSFRIVAVASGGDAWFGTGEDSIRTTQELMLHSGLPQLVREGDRYQAIFSVRNASSAALKVKAEARVAELPPGSPALPGLEVEVPAGQARDLAWEVTAPVNVSAMNWEVSVAAEGGAADRIKVKQQVIAAYPVRTYQATLEQVSGSLKLEASLPEGAVPGRGGMNLTLRAKLGDGLEGVREYMSLYPYSCFEQKVSRAIALRDQDLWKQIMAAAPSYLDSDGLLRYFPAGWLEGSDVLTAYVLAIAGEAEWEIPEHERSRMLSALHAFAEGRIQRDSALPTADLSIRRLAAIEALSRYQPVAPQLLDSIAIEPNLWPTSAVLDWINILKRIEGLEDRDERLATAQQVVRSRLNFQGTTMGFSTESSDELWWLMVSTDLNAVRGVLSLKDVPAWREDIPRMVRGALGRQSRGHWSTTTANAWGVLAMEKFSADFERDPVTGTTAASFAGRTRDFTWAEEAREHTAEFPWASASATFSIEHAGGGRPWAIIQSRAALPLREPLFTGYTIKRSVTPVEQRQPGAWNRGDVARVRLELEAQADMTWVVVDDPVPAGAAILGGGLGRDSQLLTSGERNSGMVWAAYEERRQDAFRAYYSYVPKGQWVVEYTLRYNNPGEFELPATRVEAMYAPEMFGELPNENVRIGGGQ